jgi:hypothetical protein
MQDFLHLTQIVPCGTYLGYGCYRTGAGIFWLVASEALADTAEEEWQVHQMQSAIVSGIISLPEAPHLQEGILEKTQSSHPEEPG